MELAFRTGHALASYHSRHAELHPRVNRRKLTMYKFRYLVITFALIFVGFTAVQFPVQAAEGAAAIDALAKKFSV